MSSAIYKVIDHKSMITNDYNHGIVAHHGDFIEISYGYSECHDIFQVIHYDNKVFYELLKYDILPVVDCIDNLDFYKHVRICDYYSYQIATVKVSSFLSSLSSLDTTKYHIFDKCNYLFIGNKISIIIIGENNYEDSCKYDLNHLKNILETKLNILKQLPEEYIICNKMYVDDDGEQKYVVNFDDLITYKLEKIETETFETELKDCVSKNFNLISTELKSKK